MSNFNSLLTPERVLVSIKPHCKREALAMIADLAGEQLDLESSDILDTLLARERLGSTGIGNGVAIPHGKLAGLSGMIGFFARLDEPIDFDALDDEPVDLVFVLLAPDESNAMHLKALSKIARLMRDEKTRAALRGAQDAEALLAIILDESQSQAA